MNKIKLQDKARHIRYFRKVHRISASLFFAFFFIIAISGTLLGWKKNSNGFLLPETQIGTTTDLKQWISLDSLQNIALGRYNEIYYEKGIMDRMEVRPDAGIIKFTFKNSYHEMQLDGATGLLLGHETRKSDLIENIHDGTIVDRIFGWSGGTFKVFYTTLMGVGLFIFTLTGYWLWSGPRRIKRNIKIKKEDVVEL